MQAYTHENIPSEKNPSHPLTVTIEYQLIESPQKHFKILSDTSYYHLKPKCKSKQKVHYKKSLRYLCLSKHCIEQDIVSHQLFHNFRKK